MSQSGVTVHRKADTMIPNEYIEKVIAENPNAFGAATVSEVDGQKFIETVRESGTASLDVVQSTMETFMKQDITFQFACSPEGISENDISPYTLLSRPDPEDSEKTEIQLVAFLEGNFPAYAVAGSSHPPEYHLVTEHLVPKFEGLFEMVDGDLDKLMENLKKPHFKKELMLTSVSRGTITLVAANGVCLSFAQNDLAREFPWGWTSNHYGYGNKEQAALPKKKPSMFSRSTVREKPDIKPSPAIAEAVAPPPSAGSIIKNYTVRREKPPGNLSRNERQTWYKSHIGYFPPGGNDDVAVNIYVGPDNKVLTFSQMNKALGLAAAGLIKQANNPPRGKNIEPAQVKSEDALPVIEESKVTTDKLPLISPKGRDYFNTLRSSPAYKKIIEENSIVINDPRQFEKLETKLPDFAKQMGSPDMKEFATAMLDFDTAVKCCQARPNDMANMVRTFAILWLKDNVAPVEEKKPEPKAEDTPKKPSMFKRSAA